MKDLVESAISVLLTESHLEDTIKKLFVKNGFSVSKCESYDSSTGTIVHIQTSKGEFVVEEDDGMFIMSEYPDNISRSLIQKLDDAIDSI